MARKQLNNEIVIEGIVEYGEYNCPCCEGVYGWYYDSGDIRENKATFVIGNIYDNPELLNKR